MSTARTVPLQTKAVWSDWRQTLPTLSGHAVTLRQLEMSDAASLFAFLTTEEVARFISPPPTTVEGFERFIAWTYHERSAGRYVCFAVVPRGASTAIGLFQVRALEASFATAEWGFAIGSPFWGKGMFVDGARLILDFAFDCLRVNRLEARAAVANGRGNGALRKLGAVHEATLRGSFVHDGKRLDQALWCLLSDDWGVQRGCHAPQTH